MISLLNRMQVVVVVANTILVPIRADSSSWRIAHDLISWGNLVLFRVEQVAVQLGIFLDGVRGGVVSSCPGRGSLTLWGWRCMKLLLEGATRLMEVNLGASHDRLDFTLICCNSILLFSSLNICLL